VDDDWSLLCPSTELVSSSSMWGRFLLLGGPSFGGPLSFKVLVGGFWFTSGNLAFPCLGFFAYALASWRSRSSKSRNLDVNMAFMYCYPLN